MKFALASLLTLVAMIGSVACTLTRTPARCETTSECREAFGTGYVCSSENLCDLAPANASCTAQSPADLLTAPEKYRNHVIIGSLLRAEGKEGARHDAAKLAIEAVNEYLEENEELFPELVDLRFGMIQCSHDGDVAVVADLAEYLVETIQVPAILGPASSSATSASFSQVNLDENGTELRRTVFISPSATSVALSSLESTVPGMLWRTAPTDDGQGRLMGQYAQETGTTFIAFYEDTPYGRGLYEELQNSTGDLCDDCGFSFEADSSDVVPLTRMLASDDTLDALSEVETVFFMGAQETHLNEMIERLATPEFADKIIFFSDAAASADTVAGAGENIDRVLGTRPRAAEEGEATRFFTAAYQGRHDESPLIHSFTTHAYDATWLTLLSGIRARLSGRVISPETIAEGLRLMSSPEWADLGSDDCPLNLDDGVCPPLTLDQTYLTPIIESFETFSAIDVRGASGSLDYNLETEELADSAEAFEFWHLQSETSDDITIVGGTSPSP